jgi:hypothetical protein
MEYSADMHFWILVIIIIIMGAFGGFLNHLHNFDTIKDEEKNKFVKYKYIFLGIGSASLVPAFLKMISSDLIKNSTSLDNNNCFLIFAGFCLIAAIFSRRFITTIGEKVLEAAKNAELTSNENKKQIEKTKLELTSAQERIEDVKVSVNLNNPIINPAFETISNDEEPKIKLLKLVNSYVEKTSISDYSERLKVKSEIGRKMGQIIVRYNLPKQQLLENYPTEGMYLAIAYSVDLKPDHEGLILLNDISKVATQLYTKYVILVAYRTLASNGNIKENDVQNIYKIINDFRKNADKPLIRNIEDTLYVLNFIGPEV